MDFLKYINNIFKESKPEKTNPFKSFWMAGFECTDQLNAFGNRVDFLKETAHFKNIDDDYANLSILNIKTVREGIRWSQVEKIPYEYDWSVVKIQIEVAKKHNIQIIWDICHFGFPDDLTPLHPKFAVRFASICAGFVAFYRTVAPDETLIVTPINEVSFLSWLGGDVRGTSPYCIGQGWEVKYGLMKAYIQGVIALKNVDPHIRILTTEPLVNIVANADFSNICEAEAKHIDQFQVTDILSGKMCPELGGKPEFLDILGYNYYFNNQWPVDNNEQLAWENQALDSRHVPLHKLLLQAYNRYKCPIVLTETSHPKEDRPLWIKMLENETILTLNENIPFWGICWYPIIDRPDWDFLDDWHHSGIWDIDCTATKNRILNQPVYLAFLEAQRKIETYKRSNTFSNSSM